MDQTQIIIYTVIICTAIICVCIYLSCKRKIEALKAIPFYIAYELGDGVECYGEDINPTTYTIDTKTFTLKNPTRDGYTFTGWTGSNGSTPQLTVTITQGSTGDRKYVANWKQTEYTITYRVNGGTFVDNAVFYDYTYESKDIVLSAIYRNGYTFDGWTGSNGSTPQKTITIPTHSTGDRTYEANWTPNEYTITYKLYGGTNDKNNPTSYIMGQAFTIINPTKNGYTFNGWTGSYKYTNHEGKLISDKWQNITKDISSKIEKSIIGDLELVAWWEPISYKITYE